MLVIGSRRVWTANPYFCRRDYCEEQFFQRESDPAQTCSKNHSPSSSMKKLVGSYAVLAPGSILIKMDQYTSKFPDLGKLIVTVRNGEIANFWKLVKRRNNLRQYFKGNWPRFPWKSTEAKIDSQIAHSIDEPATKTDRISYLSSTY